MTTFAQALLVGVVSGLQYAVLAAGLGLVLAVGRRLHFAIAISVVLPVFIAVALHDEGLPVWTALLVGLAAGVAFGLGCETIIYRPIVRRAPREAFLSVFVAALGVVTIAETGIRMLWPSANSVQLDLGVRAHFVSLPGGVGLTNLDLLAAAVAALLLAGTHILLAHTDLGRSMLAVQDNPEMAVVVGVDQVQITRWVIALASLLAGAVGILTATRSAIGASGGLGPTFLALVVVFLAGGGSSPWRFAVAGVSVGVTEALAAVYVSSSWSPVLVFGVLFGYVGLTPYRTRWAERRRTARVRVAAASAEVERREASNVALG